MKRMMHVTAMLCAFALLSGCEMLEKVTGDSAKSPACTSSQTADRPEQNVKVWLDGKEAIPGEVRCSISSAVSASPKLKYEITAPEKMGRVTSVMINIFQEFDGKPSGQASFIVIAADTNNPDAQMAPGEAYDLGAPGDFLRIMDGQGNALEKLVFESGMKYYMNFVVAADQSETVQVEFTAQ